MRFHTTLEFAQARQALKAADDAFEIAFNDDEASPETNAALDAVHDRLQDLAGLPAATPTEVREKLQEFHQRQVYGLVAESRDPLFEAIRNDLDRLQGHPASKGVMDIYLRWRLLYEQIYAGNVDGGDFDRLTEERHVPFMELMSAPCTTPGDFMLKTYVNLLEELGGTLAGEARANLTGNAYDINLSERKDARDEGHAWTRAAYADLDATDIGANLLAYGLPYFSAEHWMERADAVNLRVDVTVHADGKCWLGIQMYQDDDPSDFVRRERDRLQRLSAVRSPARVGEIVTEIEREWPQLVRRMPPLVA